MTARRDTSADSAARFWQLRSRTVDIRRPRPMRQSPPPKPPAVIRHERAELVEAYRRCAIELQAQVAEMSLAARLMTAEWRRIAAIEVPSCDDQTLTDPTTETP